MRMWLVLGVLLLTLPGCAAPATPPPVVPSPVEPTPSVGITTPGSPAVPPAGQVGGNPPAVPVPPPTITPTAATGAALVESGRSIFGSRCGRCHGQRGQGAFAPAIIGSGAALDKFGNSQELFNFIRLGMPMDRPGSLPEEEYLQVLAFLLAENGLAPPAAIDPGRLAAIQLKK